MNKTETSISMQNLQKKIKAFEKEDTTSVLSHTFKKRFDFFKYSRLFLHQQIKKILSIPYNDIAILSSKIVTLNDGKPGISIFMQVCGRTRTTGNLTLK